MVEVREVYVDEIGLQKKVLERTNTLKKRTLNIGPEDTSVFIFNLLLNRRLAY